LFTEFEETAGRCRGGVYEDGRDVCDRWPDEPVSRNRPTDLPALFATRVRAVHAL